MPITAKKQNKMLDQADQEKSTILQTSTYGSKGIQIALSNRKFNWLTLLQESSPTIS